MAYHAKLRTDDPLGAREHRPSLAQNSGREPEDVTV
jgi:hypothetical protein